MTESQGTKMVVCSKHGIMYDASKRGGCARCIREWQRQRATGQGDPVAFPTWVKILGLVLVVAGFYVFLTRPRLEEPPPADAAPATPQPVAGAGRDVIDEASERALRQIVDDLPDVILRGRSESQLQLDDEGDLERRRQDWEYWTVDWNARVERLTTRLPPAPSSRENMKLALVFQEVNRAVNELRQVPQAVTGDQVPDAEKLRQRFEAAERAVERARNRLTQLDR